MAISKRPVPGPRNPLRGVIDDNALKALRERNEARVKQAIEKLGTHYLLHPANETRRPFDAPKSVLPFPSIRLGGF